MSERRQMLTALWFILPAVLVLAVVLAFPLVDVFRMAFISDGRVGMGGFQALAADGAFWIAARNTLIFTVASVVGHLAIGLIVALLVNRRFRGQRFFRNAMLLPWMLPPAVVATTWAWLYHSPFGLVNPALQRLGLLHEPIAWLSVLDFALPAVIVANLWRGFPFISLLLLAGLQAIPGFLYEAASVDGATGWRQFLHVTLPGLQRVILIALALDLINTLKYFELIWIMTQGGPAHATEVFATLVYKYNFVLFRPNIAAALAVLMFAVLLPITYYYVRVGRGAETYV